MSYDALFSPFKVRGLELKNRVILPGMNTKMARDKHFVDDNMIGYHVAKAKGGCAMNITEVMSVCPEPHAYMYFGFYTDEDMKQFKKLTDAVHEVGGRMCAQLWHGGFSPQQFFDETNVLETPDTLSVERIQEIVKQFGLAAANAVKVGFDAVEFHAAHSYLPHEMLSPGTNKRTDEYGGSFENRCRFLWEIVAEVRKSIPDSMPFFMRAGVFDELMEQNMTMEETVTFINKCADLGVDVVDMSRGNAMSFATVYEVPPYNLPECFNMENIAKIKQQVKIPVMGVGRVLTPAVANQLIADGKIDLVGIGRGQIVDAEWVNKGMRGEDDKIRKCIGCLQGCYDAVIDPNFKTITCTRNPMVCLEYKGLEPLSGAPKKVMIIGGGMGGMIAAQTLKARGHEPVIFEASDKLGGNFLLAGVAPMKQGHTEAAVWEAARTAEMGIEIRLGTPVTPELIADFKPDEVIIAVGSEYKAPAIPGVDGPNVYNYLQVMSGEVTPTGNVAVVGCGVVGTEVAQTLAVKGAKVTAFEAKGLGRGLSMLRKMFQKPEFKQYGITGIGGANVVGIDGKTVHYVITDRKTKETTQGSGEFDAVIICTGMVPLNCEALYKKCAELGIKAHVIGDAAGCRTALHATKEGFAAANAI